MRSGLYLFVLCFLFAINSIAQTTETPDPFNSYRWNRKNHNQNNSKVDTGDWYEWWYYKVVVPETNESFFFTYGVVNPWDFNQKLKGSRAIVMVGDFTAQKLVEKTFPLDKFYASYDATEIKVADNFATDKRLVGTVEGPDGQIVSWDLKMEKDWVYDAMGWGMRANGFSGIYWYPAQASAKMSGWINFHGKLIYLNQAPAYQDRNWGRSFPKWWVWLVSNHFKNSPNTVLAAGGGVPKMLNAVYGPAALTIGLKHNGKEYVFRTPYGDTIKFDIRWGKWEVQAENHNRQRIEISAYASKEKFMNLPFYTPRGEVFNDYETLTGNIKVKLYERSFFGSKWTQIADLETDVGGIEWGSPDPVDFDSLFQLGRKLN